MSDTLGLGLYRSPDAIPDDLAPGQPPYPSIGGEGPPHSQPVEGWQETLAAIQALGRTMAQSGFDYITTSTSGQTDGSGNLVLPLYQCSAGDEARMHRLTVNALVPATGAAYTPAVPFSAAAAYMLVYDAEGSMTSTSDLGFTGLLDFAPPTPGGPIFPGLFEYDMEEAPLVRGPNAFILQVAAGPAAAHVMARFQICKRRARGMV